MRIAFFDAKPYDRPSFDRHGEANGITFKYLEAKLNEDTVSLARGYDGVCAFVNDTIDRAVIDRLKEDHPDAEIYLQNILPVGTKQEEKHNYVNNERIAEYNQVIRVLAEQKECFYLDVASAVTDEAGRLRADWTYDGVHLYIKGSQAWLDYLKTHTVS